MDTKRSGGNTYFTLEFEDLYNEVAPLLREYHRRSAKKLIGPYTNKDKEKAAYEECCWILFTGLNDKFLQELKTDSPIEKIRFLQNLIQMVSEKQLSCVSSPVTLLE